MSNELSFDLTPAEVPIVIRAKGDDGKLTSTKCILREASGDVAARYRDAMMRCTTLGPNGRAVKIEGMAGTEAVLVAGCLFYADTNKPVPIDVIRSWPNRVQEALHKKAKEISELDREDETVEGIESQITDLQKRLAEVKAGKGPSKNVPNATMSGSN